MKIEPVTMSSEPTVLVYNVLINCGYVESARHATVICTHEIGFAHAEEALIHLHKSFKKAFEIVCESKLYRPVIDDPPGEALATWITEYCVAESDGSFVPWSVLQGYGWNVPGRLVTGMTIEILENGEYLFSSETQVRNHIKAFKGEYVPYSEVQNFPLTSDLRMYILTVGEVKPKTPKEPKNDQ